MENLVILDIGSNSVRMAINQIRDDGSYREIKRVKNDSRLSEGMGKSKCLQPAAMLRTIKALRQFQIMYESYPHLRIKTIATAAVRQALNQNEFLDQVKTELNLDVQVLSGNQEAYYDYLGVVNQVRLRSYLLVDIGGASVELIWVKQNREENLVSLPIGAVNVSERFNLNNSVTGLNYFQASEYIRHLFNRVHWLSYIHHCPLVLLGGATRTLARINRHANPNDKANSLDHYYLNRFQVMTIFKKLLRLDLIHRQQVSGLETDRADIILGGLLPLVELMDHVNSRKVIFFDSGVREGLINEYINQRLHQSPKKRD